MGLVTSVEHRLSPELVSLFCPSESELLHTGLSPLPLLPSCLTVSSLFSAASHFSGSKFDSPNFSSSTVTIITSGGFSTLSSGFKSLCDFSLLLSLTSKAGFGVRGGGSTTVKKRKICYSVLHNYNIMLLHNTE